MSNLKLREVIKQIRQCKTAAEERAVVSKESALIRNAFKVSISWSYIMRCLCSQIKKKKIKIEIEILLNFCSSIYWVILHILVNLNVLSVLVAIILQKRELGTLDFPS